MAARASLHSSQTKKPNPAHEPEHVGDNVHDGAGEEPLEATHVGGYPRHEVPPVSLLSKKVLGRRSTWPSRLSWMSLLEAGNIELLQEATEC